jgi:hypothetical protein
MEEGAVDPIITRKDKLSSYTHAMLLYEKEAALLFVLQRQKKDPKLAFALFLMVFFNLACFSPCANRREGSLIKKAEN